jgi:hypothetical protein
MLSTQNHRESVSASYSACSDGFDDVIKYFINFFWDLPSYLIFRICFQILRQLYYRHDFRVLCGSRHSLTHISHILRICYPHLNAKLKSCCKLFQGTPKNKNKIKRLLEEHKEYNKYANYCGDKIKHFGEGARQFNIFHPSELMNYQVDWSEQFVPGVDSVYKFEAYIVEAHGRTRYVNHKDVIICACPIAFHVPRLTSAHLRNVAAHHNVFIGTNCTVLDARNL